MRSSRLYGLHGRGDGRGLKAFDDQPDDQRNSHSATGSAASADSEDIAQALPSIKGFLFVLGSLWWGRQVVQSKQEALGAKDVALSAKDEQIKAKQAEIEILERISPTRMVEQSPGPKGVVRREGGP